MRSESNFFSRTESFNKTRRSFSSLMTTSPSTTLTVVPRSVTGGEEPSAGWLARFVLNTRFEVCTSGLIVLNLLVMAAHAQYDGYTNAHAINYKGTSTTAEIAWPHAEVVFEGLEWMFGIIFGVEVVLKFFVLGRQFFATLSNVLDFLVVGVWFLGRAVSTGGVGANPTVLRVARLVKVARLLRAVRWVQFFGPLILMLKSIRASVTILLWSMVLLFIPVSITALLVMKSLETFIRDPQKSIEARTAVYEAWGSFARSVITVFEIILANWGPACRLLMNNFSEAWGVFFVLYKCIFGFAVVQVMVSVFIQQTFKEASRDEETMIREKASASQASSQSLSNLFDAIDSTGRGYITEACIAEACKMERVRMWFAAMEMDPGEVVGVFQHMDRDDGIADGMVIREDFVRSVRKMKGSAKVLDVLYLTEETRRLCRLVHAIDGKVDGMFASARRQPNLHERNGQSSSGASAEAARSTQDQPIEQRL